MSTRNSDSPVHATYLLTGDVPSVKVGSKDENEMNVDENKFETVLTRKIMLVGEDDLESGSLFIIFGRCINKLLDWQTQRPNSSRLPQFMFTVYHLRPLK